MRFGMGFVLWVALTLVACAGGEVNVGGGSDTAGTGQDTTGGGEDTTTGADSGEDIKSCNPGAASCTDGTTIKRCKSDGSGFEEETCTGSERCEGGRCVVPDPICTPNASSCVDLRNALECSSDGLEEKESFCIGGRCVDDACSPGAETAAACTQDSQCAGQSCLCQDSSCPGVTGGYCSTKDCDVWGCDQGELCINLAIGDPTPQYRCVEDCSSCNAPFACDLWPAGSGVDMTWTDACFYERSGLKPVGAKCANDSECLGGICLKASPENDAIDGGYCSAPCLAESNCPGDATCVTIPDYRNDEPLCLLSCVDGDNDGNTDECPPERPETFFIDCAQERAAEETVLRWVCFQP